MSDHWPKNTVEILTWQQWNPDLVCIYWYKSGWYDRLQYSFCYTNGIIIKQDQDYGKHFVESI